MTGNPPSLAVDVHHTLGAFHLEAMFTVGPGLAVIVGPSGSGKSLTLALVAGLARPDRGTIAIAGRVVADASTGLHLRTQERHVGMVFQDALLLPHRHVLDNVALAVRHGDRRTRRRAALGWLERVGAGGWATRHPRRLSGGQRQRVALARALAGEPRLLLLDEPFSALDQPTRRELRRLVRSVVDETRVPALFITHDSAEADELADTRITYDHGRVVAVETPVRPPAGTPWPADRRDAG